MAVEISRMRTLRELSIRKTMAAVADALHVTPSAISQQISSLESELGIQLIQRRGRGVMLTAAGTVLVRHAEEITSIYEAAKAELAELKREVIGEVRVAAFSTAAVAFLPEVIRRLSRDHPGLVVTLDDMESNEGLAALRIWEIDAVLFHNLTTSAGGLTDRFEVRPLHVDQLCCVLAEDHRLASKPTISLLDLRDENWAMGQSSPYYSDYILRQCQQLGFTPRIIGRSNSADVVFSLVTSGCAVSVLPSLASHFAPKNVVMKPLTPRVERQIAVAVRHGDDRNPAIRAFLDALTAVTRMQS